MDKKIKVGILGAGRGISMIDVFSVYHEAELVAVCDRFQPLLDEVSEVTRKHHMNVMCYNNFDDFIKHDMDAVILANYADEHVPFAVRALREGRHVLSEVLPCATMAQAVELIEAVEESGKVYAYAENYCYRKDTFEMWRRSLEGKLGEIIFAEGEYLHDCSSIWPQLTYGEKNHWRNLMYPTFYCTHSIGPMLTVSGRRPVQVVGFEPRPNYINREKVGMNCGTGIEMVTLDNGAVIRSVHGDIKRHSVNYQFYFEKGSIETGRFEENKSINLYQEGDKLCHGDWEHYDPELFVRPEIAEKFVLHNGADFYAPYFFIQKILGKPDGKWAIDVYQAVDMGICGILAWRSVLNGNQPVAVPNLRNPEERDAYRNDTASTNPAIAGDHLWPISTYEITTTDEMYEHMRQLWLEGRDANGDQEEFSAVRKTLNIALDETTEGEEDPLDIE